MDAPFSGFVLDPSKCRRLSIDERRDLIRELAKWPESAPGKLQKWSRRDLLEILCVEMGKERKYTGLTKQKLIENIFKIVSEKKPGEPDEPSPHPSPPSSQSPAKRQRKTDTPSRLPVGTNYSPIGNDCKAVNLDRYCTNSACRATMGWSDKFCKRCSCCICHKYDENKDPSLWLVCSSENLPQDVSCGISCHLECALKHERAGMAEIGQCRKLDGSFYCTFCGKVNDLLGCWRKQLVIAKDARRVDVLCHRLFLSYKLLISTQIYKKMHEMVEECIRMLEAEVGPLNDRSNMARGIVNRLAVGSEVQKLCARAVLILDSMRAANSLTDPQILKHRPTSSSFIKFKDISTTSVRVVLGLEDVSSLCQELAGYTLWHRKADAEDYSTEASHTTYEPKKQFLITYLVPATEYIFKVIAFSNSGELAREEARVKTVGILNDAEMNLVAEGASLRQDATPKENSGGLSNPSSEGDESNNAIAYRDLNRSPDSLFGYSEKPEVLDLEKSPDDACKDTSQSKNSSGVDGMEQEETAGHSVSALDEEPNTTIQTESHRDSTNSTEQNQAADVPKSENESNAPIGNELVIVPYVQRESSLPVTPCRLESVKEGSGSGRSGRAKLLCSNVVENGETKSQREPLAGSSSKKRAGGNCEEISPKDRLVDGEYEYCVRVVRWLECEGHIETNFRVKFLTWFSLRAMPQERKIVRVYIDTLIDDPGSLAGQLVDTFSDAICSRRPPPVPNGFCMKLWH